MLLHLSSWQNWFFSQSWLQPYVVCPRWQILASTWISKVATEWFCKGQRGPELGQNPAIGSLCKLPKVHPYALGSLKLDCIGDFAGFEQIIGIYKHIDSVTGRRHLMEKKELASMKKNLSFWEPWEKHDSQLDPCRCPSAPIWISNGNLRGCAVQVKDHRSPSLRWQEVKTWDTKSGVKPLTP